MAKHIDEASPKDFAFSSKAIGFRAKYNEWTESFEYACRGPEGHVLQYDTETESMVAKPIMKNIDPTPVADQILTGEEMAAAAEEMAENLWGNLLDDSVDEAGQDDLPVLADAQPAGVDVPHAFIDILSKTQLEDFIGVYTSEMTGQQRLDSEVACFGNIAPATFHNLNIYAHWLVENVPDGNEEAFDMYLPEAMGEEDATVESPADKEAPFSHASVEMIPVDQLKYLLRNVYTDNMALGHYFTTLQECLGEVVTISAMNSEQVLKYAHWLLDNEKRTDSSSTPAEGRCEDLWDTI